MAAPQQGRVSRSTSLTLCGTTCLPPNKAAELRSVLGKVAEIMLEVFAQCKDPTIPIQTKLVALHRLKEAQESLIQMANLSREDATKMKDNVSRTTALKLCDDLDSTVTSVCATFSKMRENDEEQAGIAAKLLIQSLEKCIEVLKFTEKDAMITIVMQASQTKNLLLDMETSTKPVFFLFGSTNLVFHSKKNLMRLLSSREL